MSFQTNVLYWGDNLGILRNRDYFPDGCVDLVYLDPPFNSNASYNVLFKEATGEESTAQVQAFTDTWHWTSSRVSLGLKCRRCISVRVRLAVDPPHLFIACPRELGDTAKESRVNWVFGVRVVVDVQPVLVPVVQPFEPIDENGRHP